MNIKLKIKSVYGNDLIYPACPTAELFCSLLGTKTITGQALSIIQKLGYSIEWVNAYAKN